MDSNLALDGLNAQLYLQHDYHAEILPAASLEDEQDRRLRKLEIRAECVHKFRTMENVLRCWRKKLAEKKREVSHSAIAWECAKLRLLRKVWDSWTEYVLMKQRTRMLAVAALSIHRKYKLLGLFREWKRVLLRQRVLQEQLQRVDTSHSRWLLRTVFDEWRVKTMVEVERSRKCKEMLSYYYDRRLRKMLTAWRVFVIRKRRLNLLLKTLQRTRAKRVLKASLVRWRAVVGSILKGYADRRKASALYRMVLLKKCMRSLLDAVKLRRRKTKLQNMAQQFRSKTLKSLLFKVFKRRLRRRQQRESNAETAATLYRVGLLRRAWQAWCLRWEATEEAKLVRQVQYAALLHRKRALARFFRLWTAQCRRAIAVRHRLQPVTARRREVRLRRALEAWIVFWLDSRRHHQLFRTATSFRRDTLLGTAWFRWRLQLRVLRRVQLLGPLAEAHSTQRTLKTALHLWRRRLSEQRNRLWAVAMHRKAALHHIGVRVLLAWRHYALDRKRKHARLAVALAHRVTAVQQAAWLRWSSAALARRAARARWRHAVDHHHNHMLQTYFGALKQSAAAARTHTRLAAVSVALQRRFVLKQAWRVWTAALHQLRRDRKAVERFRYSRDGVRARNVFAVWRAKASVRHEQHQRDSERVGTVTTLKAHSQLATLFALWRSRTRRAAVVRRAVFSHLEHKRAQTAVVALRAWRGWARARADYAVLKRRAAMLSVRHLQSLMLRLWRQTLVRRYTARHRLCVALWCWSRRLCTRVLHAWLRHHAHERRKRREEQAVLADRRVRLLRAGLTQWLAVGTGLRTGRLRATVQLEAERISRERALVAKYGGLWRARARALAALQPKRDDPPRGNPLFAPLNPGADCQDAAAATASDTAHPVAAFARSAPRCPPFLEREIIHVHHQPTPHAIMARAMPRPLDAASTSLAITTPEDLKTMHEMLRHAHAAKVALAECEQRLAIARAAGSADADQWAARRAQLRGLLDNYQPIVRAISAKVDQLARQVAAV